MITKRISQSEIASLKISSLPSRPTAPVSFGGRGYTATEMKAAFDALPLFIAERLNALIDELGGEGFEALVKAVPSGIEDGHTLALLLADVQSGDLADQLTELLDGGLLVSQDGQLVLDQGMIDNDDFGHG